jgi:hypothetical protein
VNGDFPQDGGQPGSGSPFGDGRPARNGGAAGEHTGDRGGGPARDGGPFRDGRTDRGGRRSRDPDLRASDTERDAVATELGEHFQAGRLSQAEFDDRLGRALAARTHRDLDELLADLPRTQTTVHAAPSTRRRGAIVSPVVVALALGVAAVAVIATGVAAAHGHRFWAPWWVIFVIFVLVRRSWWRNTPRR